MHNNWQWSRLQQYYSTECCTLNLTKVYVHFWHGEADVSNIWFESCPVWGVITMLVSLRYCTFVFWSPKYMYNQTRACEVSVCQKVVEFFEISPTIWGLFHKEPRLIYHNFRIINRGLYVDFDIFFNSCGLFSGRLVSRRINI